MTDTRRARNFLRGELLRKGYTLRDIADRHGWRYETLRMVIFRHWGRETCPRGRLTCEILKTLNRYIHDSLPDDEQIIQCVNNREEQDLAIAKNEEGCNELH